MSKSEHMEFDTVYTYCKSPYSTELCLIVYFDFAVDIWIQIQIQPFLYITPKIYPFIFQAIQLNQLWFQVIAI